MALSMARHHVHVITASIAFVLCWRRCVGLVVSGSLRRDSCPGILARADDPALGHDSLNMAHFGGVNVG